MLPTNFTHKISVFKNNNQKIGKFFDFKNFKKMICTIIECTNSTFVRKK